MKKEFVLFCLVGGVNTGIDLAVFFALTSGLDLSIIVANVLAWFVAVQFSYVANARLTFKASETALSVAGLVKFMLASVVGMVVATAVLVWLNSLLPLVAAKLFSIAAGVVFNFFLSRYFVFSAR